MLELFGGYEIGQIVVSPVHDDAALGRRMRELAEEHGVPVVAAAAGTRIVLPGAGSSPDLILDVLWPLDRLSRGGRGTSTPTASPSACATASLPRCCPPTSGSSRSSGWPAKSANATPTTPRTPSRRPGDLSAAVLKVPHHGSGGSTSDLLLRRVRPSLAAISAGASNPHGHPHP